MKHLCVLAAGLGTRFGGPKQFTEVGPSGEFLLDYSIYDALRNGASAVTLITRRDLAPMAQAVVDRWAHRLPVRVAFQSEAGPLCPTMQPGQCEGSAHALFAILDELQEGCWLLNGDDFYGAPAFAARPATDCANVAYPVGRTLSDQGGVSRAQVLEDGGSIRLFEVDQCRLVDSVVQGVRRDGGPVTMAPDAPVSMNLWMLRVGPDFPGALRLDFEAHCARCADTWREYLLPEALSRLLSLSVVQTDSTWFGMTHRADLEPARAHLRDLHGAGEYPSPLWT